MISVEVRLGRIHTGVPLGINLPVEGYDLDRAISKVENFKPSNPDFWDIEGDLKQLKASILAYAYEARHDEKKQVLLDLIDSRLKQESIKTKKEQIIEAYNGQDTRFAASREEIEQAQDTGSAIELQRKFHQWEQDEMPLDEQIKKLDEILSSIKQSN